MNCRNFVGAELRRIGHLLAIFVVLLFAVAPTGFAFAAFGDGSPTIPNASVFSAVTEDPKIDGSTGAFTKRVPLDIPPGRNGLQPDIALDYNSQRTKDSTVGYGWELSMPFIERMNKTGSEDLYASSTTFRSSLDGELLATGTTTTTTVSSTTPTILDSLPLSLVQIVNSTSLPNTTYTVPSGGENKLFVLVFGNNNDNTPTVSLNNVSATCTRITGSLNRAYPYVCYVPNPSTGTLSITFGSAVYMDGVAFTLQDAAQTNPIDVGDVVWSGGNVTTLANSVTTTVGKDFLYSQVFGSGTDTDFTWGTNETETIDYNDAANLGQYAGAWKAAASSSATETITASWTTARDADNTLFSIKGTNTTSTTTSYGAGSVHRPRIDAAASNSYDFVNNGWVMYDKRGTRYTFGSDDSGRMYDTGTGTSTNTYRWMLQEVRDTNDNYIEYTYSRDNNALYPATITYTGSGSTAGPFTVSFATSTRPDTRTSYASGFMATTTKRIHEIDASVNGSTVRKYILGYGNGNNGSRSLLTSIVQQGYDDTGALTTLPAFVFSYASSSTQYFGPATQQVDGADYAVADTDGNGINDVNLFMPGVGNGFMWHDNEANAIAVPDASHAPPEYWASTGYPNQVPLERGVRYIDVNGDGKADAARGWVDDSESSSNYAIYYNEYATSTNTYAWSATSTSYTGDIPIFAKKTSGGLYLTGGLFGDVNGDGLPDYLTALAGQIATSTYLGNGSAWDRTVTVFPAAKSFPSTAPTETASQLVDINGDNLDDWVYSVASSTYVLLNNGTGWSSVPATEWTFATSTTYLSNGNYYDRGIRFMDMNGDGLTDLVRSYLGASGGGCVGTEVADVKAVYLNTGSGWATTTRYTLPAYISTCNAGTSTIAYNEYVNFFGNGQMKQDVITNVTNPKGGSIVISYKMAGNPGSAIRVLSASTTVTHDGLGNYATTTYSYSNGHWYNTTVRDRRFAGFSPVTVTNPDSIVTTHYGQNSLARIGRPTRTDIADTSGNLKQRTLYRWDTVEHASSTFIGLGRQVTLDYAADGTHRDKATDYRYSSTTDDLIQAIEYGEVSGNTDSTEFTDTGTDKRTTNITYAASSTVNMSMPTQKTLLDYNGATSTDQKLYYDSLAFGSVTVGNNTKQEDLISSSTYASSTKTFNTYGLVATSTDRRGNATSYVYDANNLYVATSTNPLLQKTHFLYNYTNGKVRWKSDPNSSLTKNLFDGVGRLKEINVSATSSPTTYATTTVYTYTDSTTTPSSIQRSDWLFPGNTVDTYQYFDGFNRLAQERKESPDSNIFFVTDRKYSQVGLLASSTLPYSSSGSAYTTPTTVSNLYTNYLYDALKRLASEANAIGTKTNSYSKWTTTATDPNGNKKEYWYDAFGNLTDVAERGLFTTTSTATSTAISVETGTNGTAILSMCNVGTSAQLQKTVSSTSTLLVVTVTSIGVSSMTYAGQPMSLAASYPGAVETWYRANPTSGTNTIDITFNASTRAMGAATSYTGTQTGSPFGATATSTGPNGNPSLSVTTNYDNSIIHDNLFYDIAQSLTPNSQVSLETQSCSGGNSSHGSSYLATTTHGANILGWTHGGPNGVWYDVGVEVRATMGAIIQVPYTASTTYGYDTQNNLATTTDSRGNVRGFTYDGLGRRLTAQDLHNATDTTFGIWNYTYDHQGNLTSQADPKGQMVNRTYDALNRMLTEDYTGAAGTEVTLVYDSCSNGIGYLCSASSTSATTTNAYDILGRLTSAAATVLNTVYNMQYTHDRQGNVTSWTYPNSTVATVSYNTAGLPSRVQRKPSGGSFSDIVSSLTYSPTGQSITTVFGNGASTTRTYNADALYRLTNLKTLANSSNVQNFSYTYDSVGNITQIANPASASSSATTIFSYDVLNRLLSASTTAADSMPYKQQYEYDSLGGILTWATNGAASNIYTYANTGYANPHAVTEAANGVSTSTYAYDANGNLSQKVTDTVTTTYLWDYANRLTALGVNNSTSTYGYDAFGARVYQIASTTATTTYAFKWYSIASSTRSGTNYATSTEYLFNGDTLLSTVDQAFTNGAATGTASVRYIHPDHLGSTNIVTNSNGTAVVQTLDYYPYGATRISESTGGANSARKYIGQFADISNLDYLNARYYDPSRGQFISQDPVFLEIGRGRTENRTLVNPQALNSYSYATANPIASKDPSGREAYTWNILNASIEEGFVVHGYASLNIGISLVHNPDTGEWRLAPSVSGATGLGSINGPLTAYPSADPNSTAPFVLGVYGGGSLFLGGGYSPNAKTPEDLEGVSEQSSLNPPLFTFSNQIDKKGIVNYSGGLGAKGLASVSHYPVYTWVPFSVPLFGGNRNSNATQAGNAASSQKSQTSGGSSGGMVRNVVVGFMSNGAPLYCSGVCGR